MLVSANCKEIYSLEKKEKLAASTTARVRYILHIVVETRFKSEFAIELKKKFTSKRPILKNNSERSFANLFYKVRQTNVNFRKQKFI